MGHPELIKKIPAGWVEMKPAALRSGSTAGCMVY